MGKILYSKTTLHDYDTFHAIEFYDCVADLLELDDVKALSNYSQHINTNRLQHSINVSYYSYLIAKLLHCDFRSAARAGLLHDLFLYDWRETESEESHAFAHPKVALENAMRNVELNEIEKDAIVSHMWPLAKYPPKYKESFIVSMADKYCCTGEVINSFALNLKMKFLGLGAV